MPTEPKRKRVFTLPTRRDVAQPARTVSPALVTIEIREHEAAYVIGALIDAQRAAEEARNKTALAGDSTQSAVFAQKARALAGVAARVASSLAER